jgi:acyl-CoA thioesterase
MDSPEPTESAEELTQSAYSQLLGCRVLRVEGGVAEVAMTLEPALRNRLGKLHGGAMFSLVDVAMGLACSSSHGFDKQSVTLECKINYIRAVAEGEVVCIAKVIHGGRRTLVVDAEVLQGDKLMAKAQATFAAI